MVLKQIIHSVIDVASVNIMKSQCGICFKVFSRHYDMLRHKRGVHGLTKPSPQFAGYTDVIQGSITYPKQIIQHREPSHECLNTSTAVDEQKAKHVTMESSSADDDEEYIEAHTDLKKMMHKYGACIKQSRIKGESSRFIPSIFKCVSISVT